MRNGKEAGTVVIALEDGQCVFTNRSPKPVKINGVERVRSVLRHGDQVEIGHDIFTVRVDLDDEGSGTQLLPGADPYSPVAMHRICTLCGGAYEGGKGWTDGVRRLCGACIAKGMTPKHLPGMGANQALAPLSVSDRMARLEVDLDEPPAAVTPAAPVERQRRSISASMHSVVDDQGSLLKKVQSVFGGRADKNKLEELHKERQDLLLESGRLVLTEAFLGLAEHTIADLLAGRITTVRPEEVARAALNHWRVARDRLALLDAEISAMRKALGLGFDQQAVLAGAPAPRDLDRAREARAFAALDALNTEDLSLVGDESSDESTATAARAARPVAKPVAKPVAMPTPSPDPRRRPRRHTR